MTWRCPKCSASISKHIYDNGRLICPTDDKDNA